MSELSLFSQNGKILPIEQATISLTNIEYSYGYGVYETLKVRNNVVYFVDQHLERLQHSADVLAIPMPFSAVEVKHFLTDFVAAINTPACNIKMLLIGGNAPTLSIFATSPLFPDRKLYTQGTKLTTYIYERLFPTAKTLNMLPSYIAYKKAKSQHCYDALLVDRKGIILEGTRTNFYLLKNKTLIRAPKQRILEGVTLLTVEHLAQKNGFTIIEDEVSIKKIGSYDGALITSTSSKIMPIIGVDNFLFSTIPPSIKLLIREYDKFLDQCNGVFS